MRKFISIFMLAVIIPLFLTTGCRQYEDEPELQCEECVCDPCGEEATAYETLTTYLVANDMDLSDVIASGWVKGRPANEDGTPLDPVADAQKISDWAAGYNIFDLRLPVDYSAGHIEGAINVALKDVVSEAATLSNTNPILAVCYTGQTAAHAVVALRLSGYSDATVLLWGMSGWRADLDKWTPNLGSLDHANWTTTVALADDTTYDAPSFTASSTDGASILEERVNYLLDNGFKGIASTDVLASPSDYFINNFWDLSDIEHYGHIVGAHNIKPLTIEGGEISNLNPDEKIVTYCWTGQTSSMITAYLTVLGYDAVSLKFGANSMIYSTLEGHKFVAPTVDYPVVQ